MVSNPASSTFEKVLRVLMVISVILGAWALILNQSTQFYERTLQAQAAQDCLDFGSPHALLVGGETYCYTTWYGSEQIASLKFLRDNYQK